MSQLEDLEPVIRDFFEANFERLKLEGGHSLAPDVKASALTQVLMYWRRLREVAESVTETEVSLSLPMQHSPLGRTFTIEGVVDIVRSQQRTTMYDIKTHDVESVRSDLDRYAPQLNLYAYIWEHLRGQDLDESAIIATRIPRALDDALLVNDDERIEHELIHWEPIVSIPLDTASVQRTVEAFGEVVDAIESNEFSPRSLEELREPVPGTRTAFAVSVCRNCDVRFSCEPYRQYALRSPGQRDRGFRAYLQLVETELEEEERLLAALDSTLDSADLAADV